MTTDNIMIITFAPVLFSCSHGNGDGAYNTVLTPSSKGLHGVTSATMNEDTACLDSPSPNGTTDNSGSSVQKLTPDLNRIADVSQYLQVLMNSSVL